jgi:hypothetical protein
MDHWWLGDLRLIAYCLWYGASEEPARREPLYKSCCVLPDMACSAAAVRSRWQDLAASTCTSTRTTRRTAVGVHLYLDLR